jgi:hypothetical protein
MWSSQTLPARGSAGTFTSGAFLGARHDIPSIASTDQLYARFFDERPKVGRQKFFPMLLCMMNFRILCKKRR